MLAAIMLLCSVSTLMAKGYYKVEPTFHQWPDEKAGRTTIGRFGPVGIGLELIQPAFTMKVSNVEPGSPADGKLKKGQIIESINGQVLKDMDPRIILGNMITQAEAKDGVMKMMVRGDNNSPAKEVIIKIPAMGSYSPTWPDNCAKSDRIVRNFADFLAKVDKPCYGSVLFLLSTGMEKDLDVVRRWFKNGADAPRYPWDIGYNGPAVCEYYLRTGDKKVLPGIQKMADNLKKTIYNGSWAGRGGAPYKYMAGGHMNAAGVHCVTFLLLAKECGVDVDEHTLQSSLLHFYRYNGHGNVAYGDGVPEGGFVDNGRSCGLAFTMAAAASLSPAGEKSVYAKARDINATKGFYSTSWLFHGHTGGGIGELWRGSSMGLVKDKRPEQYRSFMDDRRWIYELARTHDGAFGWSNGWNVNYTTTGHKGGRAWGNFIPLVYTMPRKTLRMTGAPKTQYSKSYDLPARPWGTAADDVFFSLVPGEYKPGKRQDIATEKLLTDASMPIMNRLNNGNVSDDTLLMYAHHIEQGIRSASARAINNHKRYHLVVELLKSKDPRGRHSGLTCMTGMFKGRSLPNNQLKDEMFVLAAEMINDPDESWWVVEAAMNALGRARAELVVPHVKRLSYWLKHDDWWLRKAAMSALTPVATDKRFCKQILPVIGKMVATNQRPVALTPLKGIVRQLHRADPQVQRYALKVFGKAYLDFPTKLFAPGGQDMSDGVSYLLEYIASNIAELPGGFDELYRVSRKRFPNRSLAHKGLYLKADMSKFGPALQKAFKPIILDELVPEYIGERRKRLEPELKGNPGGYTKELVDLYEKAGVDDYSWKQWGTHRYEIQWDYHMFDPIEKKIWENGFRYRPVTWPNGMGNWYAPGFNAAAAGFKKGYAPFGSKDGELQPMRRGCALPFCRCGDMPKTLWDKEVLLMRAELEFPPVRDGYAYRLLVGGRSHVYAGDGSDVWINGKLIKRHRQRKGEPTLRGVNRREGGKAWGVVLNPEYLNEFKKGGKVTIAVSGFMNKRGNHQSIWLEEMKLPVITDELNFESAKFTSMYTSDYFVALDPGKMYRWGGKFVSNPKLPGTWTVIDQVKSIEEFTGIEKDPGRTPFGEITFKDNARTSDTMRVWSGDMLIGLKENFASKMVLKKIDGTEYLFIEAGGMPKGMWAGWKSQILVLKRK